MRVRHEPHAGSHRITLQRGVARRLREVAAGDEQPQAPLNVGQADGGVEIEPGSQPEPVLAVEHFRVEFDAQRREGHDQCFALRVRVILVDPDNDMLQASIQPVVPLV